MFPAICHSVSLLMDKPHTHKHTWKQQTDGVIWQRLEHACCLVFLLQLFVFIVYLKHITLPNVELSGKQHGAERKHVSVGSLCFRTCLLQCLRLLRLLACSASLWLIVPSQYACLFPFEWIKPRGICIHSHESQHLTNRWALDSLCSDTCSLVYFCYKEVVTCLPAGSLYTSSLLCV